MKFSDIENLEKSLSAPENSALNSFHQDLIQEYLQKEQRKTTAADRPFEYFYEDVSASELGLDFKKILGEKYYRNASGDAMSCLHICNEFRKLSAYQVSGWLQNALKFVDHLVLHYIQEICKEKPKKYDKAGLEKSRYIQLSEKAGSPGIAGAYLKDLYEQRNRLEHRTIVHDDGRQELIPPQRNKVRKLVVKLYPEVLRGLGRGCF